MALQNCSLEGVSRGGVERKTASRSEDTGAKRILVDSLEKFLLLGAW